MADTKVPIVCLKTIFSLAARERCMTNIKKIAVPRYGKVPTESTAILVPICKISDVPSLLYTVRSIHLKQNSGEVTFPGGKSDGGEDAVQTALRETFKVIGLPQSKIEVWGKGTAVPGRNNETLVTPVIGSVESLQHSDLNINTKEVSEVFTIPIEMLCDEKNQFHTQFSNGIVMPVYCVENYKIWGITAYITHIFLSSILTKDYYRNDWTKKKIDIDPLKCT